MLVWLYIVFLLAILLVMASFSEITFSLAGTMALACQGFAVTLLIALVVIFDRPFKGRTSVSPQPIINKQSPKGRVLTLDKPSGDELEARAKRRPRGSASHAPKLLSNDDGGPKTAGAPGVACNARCAVKRKCLRPPSKKQVDGSGSQNLLIFAAFEAGCRPR